MRFCNQCGHLVEQLIPAGDDRMRYVCTQCHTIHYQNPRMIVGCLPVSGDRVLLCRRAISPRHGFWTLPAGFLENGETTQQGAERETWEEAHAKVANSTLYRVFDLPHIDQIYMFYRADLVGESYGPGTESLEVELFREEDIPWQELAFPVVFEALREFFDDRRSGNYPVRASGLPDNWNNWLRPAEQALTDAD
ncbi:MAG: hydrolase [Verrucomicrobiaceae bacterium]|nr:hydrolase [Verrucomicrobiaceae bacterium]